jgi:uncharacterized paraquat-inducible protein A
MSSKVSATGWRVCSCCGTLVTQARKRHCPQCKVRPIWREPTDAEIEARMAERAKLERSRRRTRWPEGGLI